MRISDEDEYDETEHLSLSETRSEFVGSQRLNVADYIHEEVYINLSQMFDPQYILCIISE